VKKTYPQSELSPRSISAEKTAAPNASIKANTESLPNVVFKVESDASEEVSYAMKDIEAPLAGDEFISGLGLTLEGWAIGGDKQPQSPTHFHCICAPPMGIDDYLKRIHANFLCSDECYVIALVLVDRIGKIDAALKLCSLNVHRLVVCAVMLAAKFHDDIYAPNAYYAEVGGLGLKEMNQLEARLLKLLDWKVNVTSEEFREYLRIVCEATLGRSPLEKEPEPEP
jgi:hypothetical protein